MNKVFFGVFAGILVLLTLFSYLFIDVNISYLKFLYTDFSNTHREVTSILFTILVVACFAFYFYFLFLVKKGRLQFNDVKRLIGIIVTTLFLSYPAMLSYDIFNYVFTAKISFFYLENPYVVMPIDFISDPYLSFTRAANKIALYGPVWIGFTSLPYIFGGGNFIFILLLFKALVVLFYIGVINLLWKMTKNLLALSIFALNPLVYIETLVSNHNDIVMMYLVLVHFLYLKKKKIWVAGVFLLLSILVKYATLILLPFFFYISWRTIKKQDIPWDIIFTWSSLAMLLVFLISPLREEIYAWYAIWFLSIGAFVYKNRYLFTVFTSFSIGLMLGYVPYLFSGTYNGATPMLKTFLIFFPVLISIFFLSFKNIYGKNKIL